MVIYEISGLNAPPGSKSPAVADGYYLMLEPLSVGYHTIHFTGKLAIDSYYFSLDVTYNLTVARGHGVP